MWKMMSVDAQLVVVEVGGANDQALCSSDVW